MFVSVLLFFFILLSVFVLMDTGEKKSAHTEYIYWAAVFLLFILAAFRPIGVDNDSSAYQNLFINGTQRDNEVEYSFELIGNWVYNVWHEPRMLFVIYALLGVFITAYAIHKLEGKSKLLSLLVWLSYFYIAQILTEIRVAVAVAFFLLGLHYLIKGNRLCYFVTSLIAIFFHYSAVLLLPLVFLSNKINRLWTYLLWVLPVLGFVFYFIKFDPFVSLPIPYMQDKLDIYEALRDSGISGDEINVFNFVFLTKLLIYYFILSKFKYITVERPEAVITMKIYAISYFCFLFFAILPTISFRVNDLFAIVEISVIPNLVYIMSPKYVGRIFVVLYTFVLIIINIFMNNLLDVNM